MANKSIVVYGGTLAGVEAAAKAAGHVDLDKTDITLIVPDPVDHNGNGVSLGGLATVGGQNYFDIGWLTGHTFCTKGSFNWWYSQVGQFYSVQALSDLLKKDLTKSEFKGKINILYGYDIKSIGWGAPANITKVNLCQIEQDSDGRVVWGTKTCTVAGDVFIDASESGRLTHLSNFGGTTGRYDWPANKLDADERGTSGKARQQVTTLMFKIKGIKKEVLKEEDDNGKTVDGITMNAYGDKKVWGANGGKAAYADPTKAIYQFNEKHRAEGIAIKPFNMAEDGKNSNEWWINTLLVFNVDGRAYNRDKGTGVFPKDMRSDYKTVDDAYVFAKKVLEYPDFLPALRSFPKFENVELVKDSKGKPVVAKTLYLRETIHSAQSSSATARANGSEDTNYALHAQDFWDSGATKSTGTDKRNYAKRVGLNFYWLDINAYKIEDLKDNSGTYIWGKPITGKVREDIKNKGNKKFPTVVNPVYIPYDAIATNFVYNLLIPGYAASIASLGWAEARVLPNQCVLGDAAGVAAAYAVTNNKQPLSFSNADITKIQATLTQSSAKLEK